MLNSPCVLPGGCPRVEHASNAADEALRVADGAKAAALDAIRKASSACAGDALTRQDLLRMRKVIDRIDRRTKWQHVAQWTVGTIVAVVGIYTAWSGNTQVARNERAGYSAGEKAAVDTIRTQSLTTEQIAAIAGKAGAKEFAAEFTLRANPPPIASAHR